MNTTVIIILMTSPGRPTLYKPEYAEEAHGHCLLGATNADLADAFIAMPGGWGTLDELAEILTWRQLGLVKSPVRLLNTALFFNPLIEQLRQMTSKGFVGISNSKTLIVEEKPAELLTRLGVVAA